MKESNPREPEATAQAAARPRPKMSWGFWIAFTLVVLGYLAIWVPSLPSSDAKARTFECLANLKQIDGAVQQWALDNHQKQADPVTIVAVLGYLKKNTAPRCPENGTYAVTTVGKPPTCSQSAHGHSL